MAAFLNNTVWVVQAIIAMIIVYVFLGNFFKKKTWLERFGMYGEGALMATTLSSVALFAWFGTTFMYSYRDVRHESFHLGSLIFMGILAFAALACIMIALMKWQKSIPET